MRIFHFLRARPFTGFSPKRFKCGVGSRNSKYDAIIVGAGEHVLCACRFYCAGCEL